MDDVTGVFKKPFNEQVAFFRNKLKKLRPTTSSADPEYQKTAHDKAFMVAGAQCADLLSDFAAAVDKAIAQGTGLGEFQKDFDKIVDRHGWAHTGDRNWRSSVIYNTNLSTSYAAGRLAQIHEAGFSHMVYKHSRTVENPRLAHVALDGTTLPIDDPFWDTHYPPNGWGCQCRVVGISRPSDARRYADEPKYTAPKLEKDPLTGLPQGVSRGWDYKPGGTVVDEVRILTAKLPKLPARIGAAMGDSMPESFAEKISERLDEFVDTHIDSDRPQNKSMVAGHISVKHLEKIEKQGIKLKSAEIVVDEDSVRHALRTKDHTPVPVSWYKRLPEHLKNADVVILDQSQRIPVLIYLFNTLPQPSKIAIKLNFREKIEELDYGVRKTKKAKRDFNRLRTAHHIGDIGSLKNQPGHKILEGEI